jgi:hypothetical protein
VRNDPLRNMTQEQDFPSWSPSHGAGEEMNNLRHS